MRTAILHIGTEKTGTTTLQHFLAGNRAQLESRGFAYPLSAGELDSRNLVLHALDLARCEDIHLRDGLVDEAARQAFRAEFEAQAFLEAINPYFPPYVDGRPNPERGALGRIVGDASGGVGRLPLRANAIRFQAGFERSNEQVRARWFPQRAHLFDADFSAYPEEEPAPFTAADAIRVSAELWRRSAAELRRLEAEIVYRDGRIARVKKRHNEAESCFRRALELDPSHAQASAQLERVLRISAARRERRGSRFWRFGVLGRGSFP